MEPFHTRGFCEIDNTFKQGLISLNPNLIPHLYRYQGMGWYDVLIEKEGLFSVVSLGGSDGWEREKNNKVYAVITGDSFLSLDVLYKNIEDTTWVEVA